MEAEPRRFNLAPQNGFSLLSSGGCPVSSTAQLVPCPCQLLCRTRSRDPTHVQNSALLREL